MSDISPFLFRLQIRPGVVEFEATCTLRSARSAALTAHRAVIHYRRLRFAYPGGRYAPAALMSPINSNLSFIGKLRRASALGSRQKTGTAKCHSRFYVIVASSVAGNNTPQPPGIPGHNPAPSTNGAGSDQIPPVAQPAPAPPHEQKAAHTPLF